MRQQPSLAADLTVCRHRLTRDKFEMQMRQIRGALGRWDGVPWRSGLHNFILWPWLDLILGADLAFAFDCVRGDRSATSTLSGRLAAAV
ncbi:hypothetical protein LMH87_003176 [Akanthomyces muscarius]|uniref:Uncharacterized protein n=1 Tax=Akanthomyces muscarius TaxID=2231603 RepID=A0A9W8UFW7_AKAMU|nr:hypothetical protein LMH87_003176 [Akanthomyces muscarius]KAJ4144286.1 hypothetical protein LMH87_003176 [Akanthomyces muscarius]